MHPQEQRALRRSRRIAKLQNQLRPGLYCESSGGAATAAQSKRKPKSRRKLEDNKNAANKPLLEQPAEQPADRSTGTQSQTPIFLKKSHLLSDKAPRNTVSNKPQPPNTYAEQLTETACHSPILSGAPRPPPFPHPVSRDAAKEEPTTATLRRQRDGQERLSDGKRLPTPPAPPSYEQHTPDTTPASPSSSLCNAAKCTAQRKVAPAPMPLVTSSPVSNDIALTPKNVPPPRPTPLPTPQKPEPCKEMKVKTPVKVHPPIPRVKKTIKKSTRRLVSASCYEDSTEIVAENLPLLPLPTRKQESSFQLALNSVWTKTISAIKSWFIPQAKSKQSTSELSVTTWSSQRSYWP